jgi:hypothetical protein
MKGPGNMFYASGTGLRGASALPNICHKSNGYSYAVQTPFIRHAEQFYDFNKDLENDQNGFDWQSLG